jgi:hypothetical protein
MVVTFRHAFIGIATFNHRFIGREFVVDSVFIGGGGCVLSQNSLKVLFDAELPLFAVEEIIYEYYSFCGQNLALLSRKNDLC